MRQRRESTVEKLFICRCDSRYVDTYQKVLKTGSDVVRDPFRLISHRQTGMQFSCRIDE